MANIVLTTFCNRTCPYCFARTAMAGAKTREMPFREVVSIADMVVQSRRLQVALLGGEPTLHSQFPDVVRYLLERRLDVTVFTNALSGEARGGKLIDDILRLPQLKRLKFIVNVNHPGIDGDLARQEVFLRRLAANCDVSYNVCLRDAPLDFLVDLVERAGLEKRRIRVGLAQPTADRRNKYLAPGDYAVVVDNLVGLAERLVPKGVRLSFDCGWPMCIFPDEALGRLRRANADTKFVCRTALDLGPGHEAWNCFPLVTLTRRGYAPGTTLEELQKGFTEANRRLRSGGGKPRGVFEACADCVYLAQDICAGGCLGHVLGDEAEARSSPEAAPSRGAAPPPGHRDTKTPG